MRFCSGCGSALEFFEFLDGELCAECLKKDATPAAPKPADNGGDATPDLDMLAGATLCLENDKIVLKSPEGWVLWSGPADQASSLQSILSRAQRILSIRSRRKNR